MPAILTEPLEWETLARLAADRDEAWQRPDGSLSVVLRGEREALLPTSRNCEIA